MAVPLLTTKLYIPPHRSEWVPRPHLLERLNAGLEGRRLTLISAPAGSGKTSLVTFWLANLPAPGRQVAWLSLDKADNDPLRFFAYLLASLRTLDPSIGGEAQRLLESTHTPSAESMVTGLINDLAARPSPLILVLDDYHTLDELAIHEAISLLLDRQPPHLHLVLVTRLDPPLPLSRLRGRGQMVEIRQNDLSFSPEETAAFLTRTMNVQLTPVEIAALEKRTEGWITGLQLAALSMQGRDRAGIARFVADFTGRHHFILDYLTDEVLQRQLPSVQTFLQETAILNRMCGSLCDALLVDCGVPPAAQMLEQLQNANLFTSSLDDERQWYRYHPLFAELLRARIQETSPDRIPELHRRAALWYDERALSPEAVHHALHTQDDVFSAEVIERAILRIATWSRADTAILQKWLNSLPQEAVQPRPWLRLFTSRLLYISGQPELASQTLQALDEWLHDHPSVPDAARILGLVLIDRASYAAVLGQVQQAKELILRALAQGSDDSPISRFRAPAILGMAHARAGELAEAHRAFSQASQIALTAGLGFAAVPFLCNLAEVEIAQGRIRQAMRTCQRADELSMVDGTPMSVAGFVRLEMGKILFEWNDLRGAERQIVEGLDSLSRGGISESFGSGYAIQALVKQALGDSESAWEAAQQAVQIARRENVPRLIDLTSAYQARIGLAQGRVDLASAWADDFCQGGETEYLREFESLTLARVLLARGQTTEGLALLDACLPPASDAGRMTTVLEIQILRALALPTLQEALLALQQALNLAEPEGFVRRFVDGGEPMRALLKQAAVRGIAPHYVGRLLAAFGSASLAETRPPQPLLEPLTDRELEVLVLLTEDLSHREIGERLFISMPTVKSHTRNIYGKLGVHTRDQAVARARALGILPPN